MKTAGIVTVLSLLALAAACSSKKADDQSNKQVAELSQRLGLPVDTSASGSSSEKTGDPCSLLDSGEVAAAIGPLAAPPYPGEFKPNADASSCRYETKDHRRMLVSVDWSGGPSAMKK